MNDLVSNYSLETQKHILKGQINGHSVSHQTALQY